MLCFTDPNHEILEICLSIEVVEQAFVKEERKRKGGERKTRGGGEGRGGKGGENKVPIRGSNP